MFDVKHLMLLPLVGLGAFIAITLSLAVGMFMLTIATAMYLNI